jgi:hypothetical protein
MKITTGKQRRPAKVAIYGVEGIGKTTFASQFPKPLLIDIEHGTGHLDVSRVEVSAWKELMQALEELVRNNQGFETVVIDSADWAEDLAARFVLDRDNKKSIEDYGYGKGWVILAETYQTLMDRLTALSQSMHVVILAHSEIKRMELPDKDGGFDRYEIKLSKQTKPMIKEWADALLFANYKMHVVERDGKHKAIGGKERVIYTSHTAAWDAKNRYSLAEELPMKIESIGSLFDKPTQPAPQQVNTVNREKPVESSDRLSVFEGNEECSLKYLIQLGWLKEGQALSDISENHLKQITTRPDSFMKKATGQTKTERNQ